MMISNQNSKENRKLTIIAGNCVLESREISFETVSFLKELSNKYNFDLIYKSSFRKDNRSSVENYKGLSHYDSVHIFKDLKKEFSIRILTDFHDVIDIGFFSMMEDIDIVQIPAYLCMQTDLTVALARTKKIVNIKKGQFLNPEDVAYIINKIESTGNKNIMITERGTCFGYRDLVVDPRSFYILKQFGYPVFFDVGHSIRQYGVPSSDLERGGQKQFTSVLARAAIATGIDGLFVEVHPNPKEAKCDAATQLSFEEFKNLIENILPIWEVVNKNENIN